MAIGLRSGRRVGNLTRIIFIYARECWQKAADLFESLRIPSYSVSQGEFGRVRKARKLMLPIVAYELIDNFIQNFDCLVRCSDYLCRWTIASNYLCIAMKHCKNFKVSVTNSISNLVTHGCRPRQRTVIHYFVLRSGRNKENKVQVTAHLTIILQLKSFQRQRVK